MKRKDLCKIINDVLIIRQSTLRAYPLYDSSVSIQIICTDPFIKVGTWLQLSDDFYSMMYKLLASVGINQPINWNNSKTIFSIWTDTNTSLLID